MKKAFEVFQLHVVKGFVELSRIICVDMPRLGIGSKKLVKSLSDGIRGTRFRRITTKPMSIFVLYNKTSVIACPAEPI